MEGEQMGLNLDTLSSVELGGGGGGGLVCACSLTHSHIHTSPESMGVCCSTAQPEEIIPYFFNF